MPAKSKDDGRLPLMSYEERRKLIEAPISFNIVGTAGRWAGVDWISQLYGRDGATRGPLHPDGDTGDRSY